MVAQTAKVLLHIIRITVAREGGWLVSGGAMLRSASSRCILTWIDSAETQMAVATPLTPKAEFELCKKEE